MYTGVGRTKWPTVSQHNIFDLKKLPSFCSTPDVVQTSGHQISSPMLYQLNHLITTSQAVTYFAHCLNNVLNCTIMALLNWFAISGLTMLW